MFWCIQIVPSKKYSRLLTNHPVFHMPPSFLPFRLTTISKENTLHHLVKTFRTFRYPVPWDQIQILNTKYQILSEHSDVQCPETKDCCPICHSQALQQIPERFAMWVFSCGCPFAHATYRLCQCPCVHCIMCFCFWGLLDLLHTIFSHTCTTFVCVRLTGAYNQTKPNYQKKVSGFDCRISSLFYYISQHCL